MASAMPVLPLVASTSRTPGLEQPALPRRRGSCARGAIFDAAAGILALELAEEANVWRTRALSREGVERESGVTADEVGEAGGMSGMLRREVLHGYSAWHIPFDVCARNTRCSDLQCGETFMHLKLVSASLLVLGLAACDTNPGEGKSVATVSEPVAAPAPLPGAISYGFSNADSKLDFVAAKVTRKHDGSFQTFGGMVQLVDNDPTKSAVTVDVDTKSIFTDEGKLTEHLKSGDFFDVAKYRRRASPPPPCALAERAVRATPSLATSSCTA